MDHSNCKGHNHSHDHSHGTSHGHSHNNSRGHSHNSNSPRNLVNDIELNGSSNHTNNLFSTKLKELAYAITSFILVLIGTLIKHNVKYKFIKISLL